jgi:hypothetical protein
MIRAARRVSPPVAAAWLVAAWTLCLGVDAARAQVLAPAPAADRRVTLFGILATPGPGKDDPKLKEMLPQLRSLLPNHTFQLRKVESKNIATGGTVVCDLGEGFVASSQLLNPLDMNGKVQFRFQLAYDEIPQFQTVVTTPPNQIFYINRMFPNGNRLIMGLGAR